jgi:hypothetical protein
MSTNTQRPLYDVARFKKKIISATNVGATYTLSVDDTFSTVLLDRAAGIVVTLPLAVPGLVYDFYATVSVTSNAYKIITGAATEFLLGDMTSVDTDSSNAVASFTGNGTSHVSVNMTAANSNALGGLKGTHLRFTCLSTTLWMVEGTNQGAGTVATPFATS